MAEAHIAALLPTQNRVVGADENTTFLAHYDLNQHDILRNAKAIGSTTSLSLNGTSYVDCGDDPVYNNFPQGLTIEGWGMQTAASSADGWLLDKDITGYRIWGQGVHRFGVRSPSTSTWVLVDSPDALSLNTWYHVAGVVDNVNLTASIYVNGVLKRTVALSAALAFGNDNSSGLSLKIGSHSNGTIKWPGKAMNVKIWNRPLSANEIIASMNNNPTSESGLVGFWKLDDGQGIIARDSSSFHNDGIIAGTSSWSTGNSVFTLRPKEGYFGGSAIAVEESTTNLLTNPAFSTNISAWTNGSWDTMQWISDYNPITNSNGCMRLIDSAGATGFLSQSIGQPTFPLTLTTYFKLITGDPTKIRTGGTVFYTDNTYDDYTWESTGNLDSLGGGIYRVTKTITSLNSAKTLSYYQFRISHIDAAATEIIVYASQAESKSFATSFTNGTRGKGVLGYSNVLNQSAGTIAMWVKAEDLIMTGSGYRMPFRIANNIFEWSLWKDATSMNGFSLVFPTQLSINTWYYMAYTWGASGQDSYLFYPDGTVATNHSSATPPSMSGQNVMWIGCGDINGNYAFNGLIDEVRIDNVGRTQSELTAWYYSASPFWPRGIYRKPY